MKFHLIRQAFVDELPGYPLILGVFCVFSPLPGGQSKCRSPSSWKRFVGETRGGEGLTPWRCPV